MSEIYLCPSVDQHPETQLHDLRQMASQRGYEMVQEFTDRLARSVKHFLEVLDKFNRLNIEFVSFREQIDTGGPLGRAIVVIIGAIAELERNLIIERVRAGMRRARLEGTHIGRNPLILDHEAIHRERCQGQSLRQIAKGHRISAATVQRVLRKNPGPVPVQDLQKTA
jgi:DNA invertase Pin-like site-specific DNA recombinase